MAKAATKKAASKKTFATKKETQSDLPGTEQKPPKGDPVKLRAQQMAKDSEEYLDLLKTRAKIEEQQGNLRKRKKSAQARLDELAYQLAFGIQDPQLRLDEMVSEATEEAVKPSDGKKGQK